MYSLHKCLSVEFMKNLKLIYSFIFENILQFHFPSPFFSQKKNPHNISHLCFVFMVSFFISCYYMYIFLNITFSCVKLLVCMFTGLTIWYWMCSSMEIVSSMHNIVLLSVVIYVGLNLCVFYFIYFGMTIELMLLHFMFRKSWCWDFRKVPSKIIRKPNLLTNPIILTVIFLACFFNVP